MMEATCRKCGKKVDIRELYEIIVITKNHTNTFGERDCQECREQQENGEKSQPK